MPELLVVADDLTGATDTGVHFAARGLPVRVVLSDAARADAGGAGVLVIDTESRHLDPAEAAWRVAEAVRGARAAGVEHFFKKTDSTLRGNLGSELAALRAASGAAHLAFVPALPALGRTTRGGVQYLHGRPLHETEFARDPVDPVRESSVPALLRRQADLPVTVLGLADLPGDPGHPLPEPGILVLDAETDEEIDRVVQWLRRRQLLGAVAGTSALARALAETLPGSAPPPLPRLPADAAMLVVGGSLHLVTLEQLDRAAAAGFATVRLPPELLVGEGEAAELVAAVAAHLEAGRSVALRTASGPGDVDACAALGKARGLADGALHDRVAGRVGRVAREILAARPVPLLMVMGGDTLAGLIRAMGFPALLPRREVLPGVPLSELEGWEGTMLVSKAGGFGGASVVTEVRDAMTERGAE